jgi:hypothetical protein
VLHFITESTLLHVFAIQHAARYLANQEWVKTDSLKTVENTAIPIIMLVVEVPCDLICSIQSPKDGPDCITVDQDSNGNTEMVGFEDSAAANSLPTNTGNLAIAKSVRLDISFKTPSHTGLQTTQLVFILFCFPNPDFFFPYIILSSCVCISVTFFLLLALVS